MQTFFLFFCCAKSCEHGKTCSFTPGNVLCFLTDVLVVCNSCLATLTPDVGGAGGKIPRYSMLSSDPESSSPLKTLEDKECNNSNCNINYPNQKPFDVPTRTKLQSTNDYQRH